MAEQHKILQIDKFDTAKAFVEINEAFGIDRIRLGFRQYDKTAETGSRVTISIDFFLSPRAALEFAEYILSGIVKAKKQKWDANNARNDNEVFYQTLPGGFDKDGKTMYRIVKVLPGKYGYRLMANQCEGKRDSKGLIQPMPGAKSSYVAIPMDGMTLAMFARALERAVRSYDMYKLLDWNKS